MASFHSHPRAKLVLTILAQDHLHCLKFTIDPSFHSPHIFILLSLCASSISRFLPKVDPQRVWKTPWRWYAEELLECCAPLVAVKQKGITLVDFACLARCNGCECSTIFAEKGTVEEYELLKQAVIAVCTANPYKSHPQASSSQSASPSATSFIDSLSSQQVWPCVSSPQSNISSNHTSTSAGAPSASLHHSLQPSPPLLHHNHHHAQNHNRNHGYIPSQHLVVSYARKALHQTGSGHFSPIAAWDPVTESVLVSPRARADE